MTKKCRLRFPIVNKSGFILNTTLIYTAMSAMVILFSFDAVFMLMHLNVDIKNSLSKFQALESKSLSLLKHERGDRLAFDSNSVDMNEALKMLDNNRQKDLKKDFYYQYTNGHQSFGTDDAHKKAVYILSVTKDFEQYIQIKYLVTKTINSKSKHTKKILSWRYVTQSI